jgi:hypothetical protein
MDDKIEAIEMGHLTGLLRTLQAELPELPHENGQVDQYACDFSTNTKYSCSRSYTSVCSHQKWVESHSVVTARNQVLCHISYPVCEGCRLTPQVAAATAANLAAHIL